MPQTLTVQRGLLARGRQRLGTWPIAAGQTFKVGDYLTLDSDGLAVLAAASGSPVAAVSGQTGRILGRATEDAQPATGDPTILSPKKHAKFIIAEPGTEFELPIYHPTPGSAYPGPLKLGVAYELINAQFPDAVGGTDCFAADISETTDTKLILTDWFTEDYPNWPLTGQDTPPSTGTVSRYARAWAEFLPSVCVLAR